MTTLYRQLINDLSEALRGTDSVPGEAKAIAQVLGGIPFDDEVYVDGVSLLKHDGNRWHSVGGYHQGDGNTSDDHGNISLTVYIAAKAFLLHQVRKEFKAGVQNAINGLWRPVLTKDSEKVDVFRYEVQRECEDLNRTDLEFDTAEAVLNSIKLNFPDWPDNDLYSIRQTDQLVWAWAKLTMAKELLDPEVYSTLRWRFGQLISNR